MFRSPSPPPPSVKAYTPKEKEPEVSEDGEVCVQYTLLSVLRSHFIRSVYKKGLPHQTSESPSKRKAKAKDGPASDDEEAQGSESELDLYRETLPKKKPVLAVL